MVFETYTGGEHFWVRWHCGRYEIRRETPSYRKDNETIYTGSLPECFNELRRIIEANVDYDLNL